MVVQKRRPSVSKIAQAALSFLNFRDEEQEAKRLKQVEHTKLGKYFVPDPDAIDPHDVKAGNPNNVEVDEEKGHRRWWFDTPVRVGKKTFVGLEYQRKVTGPFMDLDKVESFFKPYEDEDMSDEERIRRAELYKKVYRPVTEYIWDFDRIYALQQRGELTKDEVESLMSTTISWSLNAKEER